MTYDPDDDIFDLYGFEDEDAPLATTPKPVAPTAPTAPGKTAAPGKQSVARKQIRVRPMGARLAARFPSIRSMLLTRTDGTQLLLVRKG